MLRRCWSRLAAAMVSLALCNVSIADAEPPADPLRQMCLVAELTADIDPEVAPVHTIKPEVPSAIRRELRTLLRGEVSREVQHDQANVVRVGPRMENDSTDARGSGALAREEATQAQQARRSRDVAAAQSNGQGRIAPVGGTPGGNLPAPRSNVR